MADAAPVVPNCAEPVQGGYIPFVQQRFRNETHSHTLDGAALDAYEALFDEERELLTRAVKSWAPAAPCRKEYGALRQDICTYNSAMRNGYARTCVEFESQELRGRQEAFKARVRHDLLEHYDGLARACKNLWVPAVYEVLQRKARKAMASTYPELFDLAAFDNWRAAAPDAEQDDNDHPLMPMVEPEADRFDLTWLDIPEHKPEQPTTFDPGEVLNALRVQSRPCEPRKLYFLLLKRANASTPSLAGIKAGVAALRAQLRELAQQGKVQEAPGLLAAWDEPIEPTWRIADGPSSGPTLSLPVTASTSEARPECAAAPR